MVVWVLLGVVFGHDWDQASDWFGVKLAASGSKSVKVGNEKPRPLQDGV